ncbi:hypothetical protein BN59_01336 [Legionella massiliensis]|uniref:Uncharacterized protein n=1 Tax=Legionella massiliensis TaxID=1034943 RepID=A0A078KVM7_9GAMM|nr:hypothetical protein [Legionella massiliensis]CDZ77057.1 hypothetical protein BN59_01336 [Legionella massiliensis]CEE12795.1 hypothetical protein BN1094_01336 [Legionella massiliensis]
MNKTLAALVTKLTWQLAEINQSSALLAEQMQSLQNKLAIIQEQIENASQLPAQIQPEQEISRLNFLVRSQEDRENLALQKKELLAQQTQLKTRQLRLNTELIMLEKYQEKQQKNEQKKTLAIEQKESDEWIVQRRELA